MHWSLPLCTSPPTPWSWETELDRNTGPKSHAPDGNIQSRLTSNDKQGTHAHTHMSRNLMEISFCSFRSMPPHEIMCGHLSVTLLVLSTLCKQHKDTVFMVWGMSSLGCLSIWGCWAWVSHLPENVSLQTATGWQSALPSSLTTSNVLPHLISAEHCGNSVCRKVSQKHKNTYVDMLMNTVPL